MHILFLTSRLPYPPNRGDRLRVFNFIRELSHHHQITLISFIADESEIVNLAALRPYCEDIQLVHLTKTQSLVRVGSQAWRRAPLQALYYDSAMMQHAVNTLTDKRRFDLVYAHLFRMARYAVNVPGAYRVLDLTDVISSELDRAIPYQSWPRRLVYQLETPRIRRYERELVNLFDETWVISNTEKATLTAGLDTGHVVVVPNGVDSEQFHPLKEKDDGRTVLFVGHMSVPHNEDAAVFLARDIMPLIRHGRPDARLMLIGAEPSERVRRLANLPGVEVLGHVSDLNRALNEAAVFVAPLRFAAGVQNKVLEAMAAGTPVVTTSIVRDGINAVDGTHLRLADTAESIAEATLLFLSDPELSRAVSLAARDFVMTHFRWNDVSRRVEQISALLPLNRM